MRRFTGPYAFTAKEVIIDLGILPVFWCLSANSFKVYVLNVGSFINLMISQMDLHLWVIMENKAAWFYPRCSHSKGEKRVFCGEYGGHFHATCMSVCFLNSEPVFIAALSEHFDCLFSSLLRICLRQPGAGAPRLQAVCMLDPSASFQRQPHCNQLNDPDLACKDIGKREHTHILSKCIQNGASGDKMSRIWAFKSFRCTFEDFYYAQSYAQAMIKYLQILSFLTNWWIFNRIWVKIRIRLF